MLSGFAKLRIIPWRFPVFTVHRENHRTLLCDHIDLPSPRIILHDDSFPGIKSNTLHAFLAEPFEFLRAQGSGNLMKRYLPGSLGRQLEAGRIGGSCARMALDPENLAATRGQLL